MLFKTGARLSGALDWRGKKVHVCQIMARKSRVQQVESIWAKTRQNMPATDKKNTYILTWNPSLSDWTDYSEAIVQSKAGNPYKLTWSTGSRKTIEPGSRVVMFRQNDYRGIVAAGIAISDVFQSAHWDESDRKANYVDAELEVVLPVEQRLPLEILEKKTSFTWNNMPSSGMSLPPEDAQIVEKLLAEHFEEVGHSSKKVQNPKWQRDELILALDLYFRHHPKTLNKNHPKVIELSSVLNALPIHENRPDAKRFRNANGVYMKLGNFLRFDPEYGGTGLSKGGKLEENIWNEFSNDRENLRKLAKAIIKGLEIVKKEVQLQEEDEVEFPEGRVLYRLHRKRERNSILVKKKKAAAKSLCCEACGFDFLKAYGEIGRGFIECHHTVPISEYKQGQKTKLEELALVCANCHRMLHRRRPWLTIAELAALLSQNQGK